MILLLFLFNMITSFSIICRTSETEALEMTRERINLLASENKFSGVILVAKNETPIFTHAVGFANLEKKEPNTINTKFNIASMGKMFTGVSIAQLVQQGKLTFNDTIEQHLPNYPNNAAAKITVHQLLTHTGRLGDIFGPEFDEHQDKFKTPQDYIDVYGNRDLHPVPEDTLIYSNYGYVILGAIIEKVSGQSFDAYVREHIYKKADMKDSEVYIDITHPNEYAIGYHANDDQVPTISPVHLTGCGSPAGGNYSTVHDLFKFAQGLLTNTLLNTEYTNLITTGKVSASDCSYGYGFTDEKDEDGVRWFGHGGGCIGMNTELRIYPKSGYIIIMLSNSDRWRSSIVSEFIGKLLPQDN